MKSPILGFLFEVASIHTLSRAYKRLYETALLIDIEVVIIALCGKFSDFFFYAFV